MIERAGIKLVDVTGIEPVTPCLQSSPAKTLNALSGVAYAETDKTLALSSVPRLSRTRPKEQRQDSKTYHQFASTRLNSSRLHRRCFGK